MPFLDSHAVDVDVAVLVEGTDVGSNMDGDDATSDKAISPVDAEGLAAAPPRDDEPDIDFPPSGIRSDDEYDRRSPD